MSFESKLIELQAGDWEIRLRGNPSLAHLDLGRHCSFYHGDAEFGDLTPRFASPHVNVLEEKDASRAFIRIKTILRIISGIRVVCGYKEIKPLFDTITYNYNNGFKNQGTFRDIKPNDDLDIFIEELKNPFDNRVNSLISKLECRSGVSKVQDYFQLSVLDSLVREVIILFTLGEEEPIYFLINTYKIMESLKNEYHLGINNNKLTKKVDSKPIPDHLFVSLSNLYTYSRYINSRDAAGVFSRHGVTNVEPPLKKPSIKEIRNTLITSVDYWLNHRCEILFEKGYI